uniref:Staphylococcal nuclease domain-containing protein n=1 Tax=Rhabditophanes sp. KR3021 TaxID=114890 RepID=A0AC35TZH4_9BILA
MTDSQTAKTKIAYVKQVLSGDSVVLLGTGDNKDIFAYLSYVKAPHLGKAVTENNAGARDEPYAWESREFMRKRIVGNRVFFVRDYYGSNGREFGQILFGNEDIDKCENIAELAIQAGWLETKPGKQLDEVAKRYLALQEQAISAKVGKWNEDPAEGAAHIRDVKYNVENTAQFVSQHKGKPVKAIIENVRDGSSFRAYVPSVSTYVSFVLSGIRCPAVGRQEPFAEEAKSFVEARLLNREIDLLVEGADNTRIVASIAHRAGNIAVLMLQEGYGKCVDWSMGLVTGGGTPFREAERKAKEARRRVWKDWAGAKVAHNQSNTTGKVIEVGLGDNITIQTEAGQEIKYFLASVRPPRSEVVKGEKGDIIQAPVQSGKQFRPMYDIPFMFEAREFLRKKLIGKNVKVIVDYVQPKSDQYPEKTCATILLDKENVGESLVKKGLAKVLRHKKDDENRSSQYDLLITAEKEAEESKVNIWSDKQIDSPRISEVQGDLSRSKQFLPTLTRVTKLTGVVEFVSSGSRFRLYIPKEKIVITLALSGISCPRLGRPGANDGEPFSVEALKLVKNLVYQHDVEFEVESVDKSGGFIGHIFVSDKGVSTNLSKFLIENGLASVHGTVEKTRFAAEFWAAEELAKKRKLNLWANYVEEVKVVEAVSHHEDKSERKENFKRIAVSNIDPKTLSIWIQTYELGNQLCDVMDKLQIAAKQSGDAATLPKRGEICIAKYTADGQWNRARVEGVKDNKASVYYIDYGNSEELPYTKDNLRPLAVDLKTLPAVAKEIHLAFTSPPSDDYYKELALENLSKILYNEETIYASPEYKVGNVDYFTLAVDQGDKKKYDVGKKLVAEGFLVAEERREPKFKSIVAEYQNAEKAARIAHLNIWRYGDFTGNEL